MSKLKEEILKSKANIIQYYKETYSVSDILFRLKLGTSNSIRNHIVDVLKDEGIYQGVGGLSALHKQKKIQKTMMEKYGVINIGQIYGWKNNDAPKTELKFIQDFRAYSDRVGKITLVEKKKLIQTDYCYYTGIKFTDGVNPNDPLRRSVDHKVSLWKGYIGGISENIIGSASNLVFCLKYCNTMKSNMSVIEFTPFAKHLREKMIDEGFKSN